MSKLTVTETPNELTDDIDISSPIEILRILRQSDAQLFSGWRHYPCIYDAKILRTIDSVVEKTKQMLINHLSSDNQENAIIITGAGTSGRLAFFVAREFNSILKRLGKSPLFYYLIAGGDKALLAAQEIREDDPNAAVQDLQSISDSKKNIILIGITCGFSAPYVAGQLDFGMENEKFVNVLLGFNPVELSRDVPVENWNKTFKQVAQNMEFHAQNKPGRHFIINPVYGPESITGSTRMKGGSATKILLELIFARAFYDAMRETKSPISDHLDTFQILQHFERTFRETYLPIEQIQDLIQIAGNTLNSDGSIYYISEDPSFGIVGLIDASECPPTYGARHEDVKCFINGGWKLLNNRDGDISHYGAIYKIELGEIRSSSKDLFILLNLQGNSLSETMLQTLQKVQSNGATICSVHVTDKNTNIASSKLFKSQVQIQLSTIYLLEEPIFGDLALKWVLNAITTGAHIIKGKIYKNKMIDVGVSNNKLYERAVRIISQFGNVKENVAEDSLLKSIYKVDDVTVEIKAMPISKHIENAMKGNKIVPRALLLTTGKLNWNQATEILNKEPVVRKVIQEYIKQ